ncbi:histone deacetylase 6 isoform X3 [Belonocnema kinseyi]|uniref:histone deacetylase 6 isoform X3 n=1 Tax=Belonocnema kinseyi TaxID=2817044 RepID=UPI00143D0EA2|nr:histone deacetylase 6 isoform X3 [Belonocnema kinseyi]
MAAKRKAVQLKKLQAKSVVDETVRDIYDNAINSEKITRKDTGIVFDNSMTEHRCLWDPYYPECPERLSKILDRCHELKLVSRCKIIRSRPAEEEDLLLKHDKTQIEVLKSTDGLKDIKKLEKLSSKYDAIYVHPSTYRQSLRAVGSTINLIEHICKGEIQNGMAIIRPPGHHAMKAAYCGYCFFNNVAIACEKMLINNLAKKILIVDWDVHHGQASQQMFYNDPRVVYFSIHRYEHGDFWPNLKESDYDYTGCNAGKGFNFNVPLNKIGMTNADYIAIFQQVLLPMAYEGEMEITPACYPHLLWPLLGLANGKVAVILEGGYCLESLAEGAALTLRTLLGDPCPNLNPLEDPCESICETILNVIYTHKAHWKCFQYQESYSIKFPTSHQEEITKQHVPVVRFRAKMKERGAYETRDCYPVISKEKMDAIQNKLTALKLSTNLKQSKFKLSVAYDSRMLRHYNILDACHPEKPERITNIFAKLGEYGVLKRCLILQGRMATEEDLLLVHSKDYMDVIKSTAVCDVANVSEIASKFGSVYLHTDSWFSARVAAGSLLQVVDNVLTHKSQSGIAIIRPPGHHADQNAASGFCLFNNTAIAAKYAIKHYYLKRILIVDWDIHHGNGTQKIFEDDPAVLYISVHRYDNGNFFPNSGRGNYSVVGDGIGEGYNVNIPWNEKGMGDAEYIAAFQQIVLPIAYQFDPELILVSAGFDACAGDPLGGCNCSPELYGHLTHWLSSLANGQIILILEGGYNVNSISFAMTMCSKALLGDPLVVLPPRQIPIPSAITSIKNVLKYHKKYWINLKFLVSLPEGDALIDEMGILDNQLENVNISNQHADDHDMQDIVILNSSTLSAKNQVRSHGAFIKEEILNEEKRSKSKYKGENTNEASGFPYKQLRHTDFYCYPSHKIQELADDDKFAIIPKRNCPHLNTVNDVPKSGIDVHSSCEICANISENWICLQCYSVCCARNINQHALMHEQHTRHPLTLSFSDLSVWCYRCESYIDDPILYAVRNATHKNKFGQELPWTYEDTRPGE